MNDASAAAAFTRDASIHPEGVYVGSRAMVRVISPWHGITHGLNSASLRYFNAAGASFDGRIGEDRTYSFNPISLAMKAVLLDEYEFKVFGADYETPDGTCIRYYTHVEDLADAHVKAICHLGNSCETTAVNLGTGTGSSMVDVINATAAVAQEPVAHEIVARRAGDLVSTYANPNYALKTLG